MNKEKFLELASQLFDQSTKLKEEEKIQIEVNLFEEIVDQITSEVFDNGIDELGLLFEDCDGVPMIKQGTEWEKLSTFLDTSPELKNIYFEVLSNE